MKNRSRRNRAGDAAAHQYSPSVLVFRVSREPNEITEPRWSCWQLALCGVARRRRRSAAPGIGAAIAAMLAVDIEMRRVVHAAE
jgi:hypothetical protein